MGRARKRVGNGLRSFCGKFDLIVIGDANVDQYVRVDGQPPVQGGVAFGVKEKEEVAGTGINTAVAAARLGLKVAIITAVGEDDHGKAVIEALKGESIDISGVKRVSRPTGNVLVMIDETGERTFWAFRIDCADWQLRSEYIPVNMIACSRALYVTGVVASEAKIIKPSAKVITSAVQAAKQNGVITFFDPNIRAKDWDIPENVVALLRQIAESVDYYLPNELEYKLIGFNKPEEGDFSKQRVIIIKEGSKGCLVLGPKGIARVPPKSTIVVDATGAGDAFNAGFITGILRGGDPVSAAELGSAVAALTISKVGTLNSFPKADDVVELLDCGGD